MINKSPSLLAAMGYNFPDHPWLTYTTASTSDHSILATLGQFEADDFQISLIRLFNYVLPRYGQCISFLLPGQQSPTGAWLTTPEDSLCVVNDQPVDTSKTYLLSRTLLLLFLL
jgi:hypothetical protein